MTFLSSFMKLYHFEKMEAPELQQFKKYQNFLFQKLKNMESNHVF